VKETTQWLDQDGGSGQISTTDEQRFSCKSLTMTCSKASRDRLTPCLSLQKTRKPNGSEATPMSSAPVPSVVLFCGSENFELKSKIKVWSLTFASRSGLRGRLALGLDSLADSCTMPPINMHRSLTYAAGESDEADLGQHLGQWLVR